jgi:hypothetical protein
MEQPLDHTVTCLLEDPRLRRGTAYTPVPFFEGAAARLPVLPGGFHEWYMAVDFPDPQTWHPPMTIMAALAASAAKHGADDARLVWIGRRCWPAFQLLDALDQDGRQLLARSIFLDPLTDVERFWAIGQAFRCPAIDAVIADGSHMTPTISRRLQLAAENRGVLGLLARPFREINQPTYAATRWEVRPCASRHGQPEWCMTLRSCRGQQRGQDAPQNWTAQWNYQVFRGTGALHLFPRVGCGFDASPIGGAQARPRTA